MCVCVCVPFWNATLNLFGQSGTVWEKGFCFGSQTTQQFISLVSIFIFALFVTTHLFASGDPYHYLKLFNKDTFFFKYL